MSQVVENTLETMFSPWVINILKYSNGYHLVAMHENKSQIV